MLVAFLLMEIQELGSAFSSQPTPSERGEEHVGRNSVAH